MNCRPLLGVQTSPPACLRLSASRNDGLDSIKGFIHVVEELVQPWRSVSALAAASSYATRSFEAAT